MIHCIGDSHVSIFMGVEGISQGYPCSADKLEGYRTYRIGAYLAYNVGNPEHAAFKDLCSCITDFVRNDDTVLLSFGEIDCRAHVIKQAEIQKKSIENISKEIAVRYSNTILFLNNPNYRIIVYAPIPTVNGNSNNEFPHIGTMEQRNIATKSITEEITNILKPVGIPVISVFEELVDRNLITDYSYYTGVHLSQKVLPLILKKINTLPKD